MHYKTETLRTTNHQVILDWARSRDGKPVRIPKEDSHEPGRGSIEITFPRGGGDDFEVSLPEGQSDSFEEITWNEFLEDFENKKLVMIYKEDTPEGHLSRFYKLEKRDNRRI